MNGHLALAAEPLDRLGARTNMFITAVLQCDGISSPVMVRNMSALGAMLDIPSPPRTGKQVLLRRGSLHASGEMAWSINQRCGVRFATDVQVAAWMARPTAPEQVRVDEIVAQIKRGTPSETLEAISAHAAGMDIRDRLAAVSKLLERLSDVLSADLTVIARHGTELQNLDMALQIIAAIPKVPEG